MDSPEEIAALLSRHRFNFQTERELHEGIAECLSNHQISFAYECRLSPEDRPDFMVGATAIEAKIKGSLAEVTRQLHRYAAHNEVRALVLVTSLARHRRQPRSMLGKPVRVVFLGGL